MFLPHPPMFLCHVHPLLVLLLHSWNGRCQECNHVVRPNIELNTALLLREYQWSAYGDDLPQERRFGWIRAIAVDIVRTTIIITIIYHIISINIVIIIIAQSDRRRCPTASQSAATPSKRTTAVQVVAGGERRMVSCG